MLANPLIAPEASRVGLEDMTVLVAEPDIAVAEVLAFMLETGGAEVHLVHEMDSAILALSQVQPDLLICNLKLPPRDGYTLLHHWQQLQDSTTQSLPAIAIAHSPWKVDRQKAVSAGFHHYLFEPLEYSALMTAIVTTLQRWNWQSQNGLVDRFYPLERAGLLTR